MHMFQSTLISQQMCVFHICVIVMIWCILLSYSCSDWASLERKSSILNCTTHIYNNCILWILIFNVRKIIIVLYFLMYLKMWLHIFLKFIIQSNVHFSPSYTWFYRGFFPKINYNYFYLYRFLSFMCSNGILYTV